MSGCCDDRKPGEHCKLCEYWEGLEEYGTDQWCNCPRETEDLF